MHTDVVDIVCRSLDGAQCMHGNAIVAVSGGIDSIVLLSIMHRVARERGLTLIAAHANHGLRGVESDADEVFVRGISTSLNLEYVSELLDVEAYTKSGRKSIEAAARELRYDFLLRTAKHYSASYICVAHTADDVAETMLMHLARGSGIDGLSAHGAVRELEPNISLVRPMLMIQRSDVEAYAQSNNLTWREDSSNSDLHFLRNQVRSLIMPNMKKVFGAHVGLRMTESSEYLGQAKTFLRELAQPLYNECIERVAGDVHILAEPLIEVEEYLKVAVLRSAIRTATSHIPTAHETGRVVQLLSQEPGSIASLSAKFVAVRERDRIVITGTSTNPAASVVIEDDGLYVALDLQLSKDTGSAESAIIESDETIASIDARSIHGSMVWRTWMEGDRLVPFGMKNTVLVSDLLTNAKTLISTKKNVRVISDDEGILWVCGFRQAERTRITNETSTVITLRMSHQSEMYNDQN